MTNKANGDYEVLSPWAEADPIPFKGLSPRLDTLEGKTIGMLRNSKRAALPLMNALEQRLKGKYPTAKFTEIANMKPNQTMIKHEMKDEFEDWLKGVDAVVASVGD